MTPDPHYNNDIKSVFEGASVICYKVHCWSKLTNPTHERMHDNEGGNTLNMFRPLCQNNNTNIILLSEYKIGCFKTPPGLFSETLGDFRKESDPAKVLQCKELTREKNYTVFALGHGGLCMSGPDAQDTYYQYKPPAKARRCKNGIGIGKTSVVYTFGNYHNMFCLLFCETRSCYVVEWY